METNKFDLTDFATRMTNVVALLNRAGHIEECAAMSALTHIISHTLRRENPILEYAKRDREDYFENCNLLESYVEEHKIKELFKGTLIMGNSSGESAASKYRPEPPSPSDSAAK